MIPMPRIWSEFDGDQLALQRLEKLLESWERTPYAVNPGENPKGQGINCAGFLFGLLDELHRVENPTPFPVMPLDTGMNNPAGARAILKKLLTDFPDHGRVNGVRVQPGDILAVGQGGPGHAMIVGPRRNTIWHAGPPHVHYTGWVLPPHSKLFAVYRLTNRDWS